MAIAWLKPIEIAFRKTFLWSLAKLTRNAKSVGKIEEPRSILLLRQDRLGDVIMSTFLMRALRDRFPNARISLLLGKNNIAIKPLLPFDFEVFVYTKNLSKDWAMLGEVRRRKFDVAIDLTDKASVTSSVLISMCGAATKIGFEKENSSVYDIAVPRIDMERYHVARRTAELLRPFEIDAEGVSLKPELRLNAPRIQGRVGFNVSARVPQRCAPVTASIEIVRGILEHGFREVVIFAAPNDMERGEAIVAGVNDRRVHLADKGMNFTEFAESVASCEYLITTDTSTTQIAAAAGLPTVVLLNPTPGEHAWTPMGVAFESYTQFPALENLESQPVLALFRRLVERVSNPVTA
jgi:ADP-heptose:LPS heptosyltransferase